MTMPSERTRALRWAGEFLEELSGIDLPGQIKHQIPHLMRHSPSGPDIARGEKLQSLIAAHPEKAQRHEPWQRPKEPK